MIPRYIVIWMILNNSILTGLTRQISSVEYQFDCSLSIINNIESAKVAEELDDVKYPK